MHDGPVAMVMRACLHLDVTSGAMQDAMMTARSMVATMRLRPGRDG